LGVSLGVPVVALHPLQIRLGRVPHPAPAVLAVVVIVLPAVRRIATSLAASRLLVLLIDDADLHQINQAEENDFGA
jgi:hypothetical protein